MYNKNFLPFFFRINDAFMHTHMAEYNVLYSFFQTLYTQIIFYKILPNYTCDLIIKFFSFFKRFKIILLYFIGFLVV